MAGSGSKVLFVVESRGDRSIAHAIGVQLHRQEHLMTSVCNFSRVSRIVVLVAGGWLAAAGAVILHAQVPAALSQSAVTVSASSTVTVQNDRLQAWLRTEAESANPAAAASQGASKPGGPALEETQAGGNTTSRPGDTSAQVPARAD